MYLVRGFNKTAQVDDFEHGCIGDENHYDTGSSHNWTSDTVDGVVKELMDFLCIEDKDAVELDACDEIGRIDIQRTENAEGYEPSKSEIEEWKKGKLKMWLCDYTFHLESIETVSARTGKKE